MTALNDGTRPGAAPDAPEKESPTGQTGRGPVDHHAAAAHESAGRTAGHGRGHRLVMLLCCVPLLLLTVALVASGAAGAGAILYALLCMVMMAAMMFAMPGHRH